MTKRQTQMNNLLRWFVLVTKNEKIKEQWLKTNHVIGRSDICAHDLCLQRHQAAQSKVANLQFTAGEHHNIGRLQI